MSQALQLAEYGSKGVGLAFKNRIINGAIMISQRNGTSSVTPAHADYIVDRWRYSASQASKFTAQQNAGSVTPPAGFTNYLGLTVASAVTIGASDYFELQQRIEGLNIADLGWGSANAKTVTLSFWVRSSLTGTFGGSLQNSAGNRCYPFSYTISASNTWEQKSITIAGDTTGTWLTTNGIGIILIFGLGVGSNFSGTAGAWGTSGDSVTGATSVVGTNGATFYITGVQLEVGTAATSFDYRSYGTELALCQRYYQTSYDIGTAVGSSTNTGLRFIGWAISGGSAGGGGVTFEVPMRAAPTLNTYDGAGTANNVSTVPNNSTTVTNGRAYTGAPALISTNGFFHQGQQAVGNVYNFIQFAASSEL